MRVHQPGGSLLRDRSARVEDWSWRRTRRRYGILVGLTAPYRTRAGFSVFSLLAATATALAPPYLATTPSAAKPAPASPSSSSCSSRPGSPTGA